MTTLAFVRESLQLGASSNVSSAMPSTKATPVQATALPPSGLPKTLTSATVSMHKIVSRVASGRKQLGSAASQVLGLANRSTAGAGGTGAASAQKLHLGGSRSINLSSLQQVPSKALHLKSAKYSEARPQRRKPSIASSAVASDSLSTTLNKTPSGCYEAPAKKKEALELVQARSTRKRRETIALLPSTLTVLAEPLSASIAAVANEPQSPVVKHSRGLKHQFVTSTKPCKKQDSLNSAAKSAKVLTAPKPKMMTASNAPTVARNPEEVQPPTPVNDSTKSLFKGRRQVAEKKSPLLATNGQSRNSGLAQRKTTGRLSLRKKDSAKLQPVEPKKMRKRQKSVEGPDEPEDSLPTDTFSPRESVHRVKINLKGFADASLPLESEDPGTSGTLSCSIAGQSRSLQLQSPHQYSASHL